MKKKYIAPIIEVEEIVVEKGFAGSHGNGHAHGKAGKWDEIEDINEWDWEVFNIVIGTQNFIVRVPQKKTFFEIKRYDEV